MATAMPRAHVQVLRADGVPYDDGLRWQLRAAEETRRRREIDGGGEALALIQHEPVYTMGARGGRRHLLADSVEIAARGARIVDTDRGGDITFHGPGQLVAYPVLDLRHRGLHAADYVRALERCVIETLAAWGIAGQRRPGYPGVWVAEASGGALALPRLEKIAAIGVRIAGGVSRHGLALNVSTDLSWFEAIVPCGIRDAGVTSMERVLGQAPPFEAVVTEFAAIVERVFDLRLAAAAPDAEGVQI